MSRATFNWSGDRQKGPENSWLLRIRHTAPRDFTDERRVYVRLVRTRRQLQRCTIVGTTKLRIWGSEVRILPGAPASSLLARLFCPLCRQAASTPGAPWKRGGSRNGLAPTLDKN